MRIIIINAHYSKKLGGSEIQCHLIAKTLFQKRIPILYAAINGYDETREWPYPIISVSKSRQQHLSALIREESIDIVYWRYNKKLIWPNFREIARLGVPIIFAVSHINDLQFRAKKKGYHGFRLSLKENLKAVIKAYYLKKARNYISGYIVNNEEHYHLIPDNINKVFIPNGVFTGYKETSTTAPYILWVGNLKKVKKPESFFALAKALEDTPVQFYMIGKVQESFYNDWLKTTRGQANFKYLGALGIEETNGFIKNALFLVHTCAPEGFPNVFLQAWAFGKPVISLNYDPSSVIVNNRLGAYSEGNFSLFEKQVREYLANVPELVKFQDRCKNYINKNHNIYKSVDLLIDFIKAII